MVLSRQRAHNRRVGFTKGHKSCLKGKSFHFAKPETPVPYVRLPENEFADRIYCHDGVLTFRDTDGRSTNVKPLRPRPVPVDSVDQVLCDTCPDSPFPVSNCHKVYDLDKVSHLYDSGNRKHGLCSKGCDGRLLIDSDNSKKWGLVWSERLKCTKCSFVSDYCKLYEEVEGKSKRGRKAATVNVGLQLGLSTTPISNTGICRVLNNANIVAPSISSMQRLSNKVLEEVISLNQIDMQDKVRAVVKTNTLIGQTNPLNINVEGDTCYNNKIFNADTTPFQAGTIATTTFCENNTRSKRIIGVNIASKLCLVASRMRNKGEEVTCPHHAGYCTADISESSVIGNEGTWSEKVAKNLTGINIAGYTGDGDSTSHAGVQKAQPCRVNMFKDVRHLGNSVRRAVYSTKFSSSMFSGPSRCNLKNRFALSIKQRCHAELKQAHKKYNGHLPTIKFKMPMVIDTIVLCFNGYCGQSCKDNSLVCSGNYRLAKNFMPANVKVRMTEKDQDLLKQCIGIMLGIEALEKTKLLTSTQKCEAVNRSYQAVNPKMVTNPRTFKGRIHGQIHKLNNGYTRSMVMKARYLGAPIKNPAIIRQMMAVDKRAARTKDPGAIERRKVCRYSASRRRYNLHEKEHYSPGLTDGKPAASSSKHLKDHNYV